MKKSLLTKLPNFYQGNFTSYHNRLEATLNYYLHHNSNLNDLSSLRNHIVNIQSKQEFILLRDNYCFRTIHTAINLAQMVNQSLKESDYLTASLLGQNLFEETGEGNSKKSHVIYMINLFNTVSKEYFKVDTIEIGSIRQSQHITESTLLFVDKMAWLYQSDTDYRTKLGVVLAHENTAPTMLYELKNILTPFIITLSEEHQNTALHYFNCHLEGIEEKHGSDILRCTVNVCENEIGFNEVIKGIRFFHTYQGLMWKELKQRIGVNSNIDNKAEIVLGRQ